MDISDTEKIDAPESDEIGMDDEVAEIPEGAEPIPAEESFPEELPAEEVPPGSDIPAEREEITAPEEADISTEPIAESIVEEGPRIAKLTEAFESGKISKELFEKNLKRFKGE